MKKRIGTMLAAGALACTMTVCLALTGCGAGVKPDFKMPEGGFDTENPVTITFYHTMNQDLRKVLNYYIDEFQNLYPNITVKEDAIGGYDDVRNQLVTEIQAGNQPNIAYCYPDHVALFNVAGAVQSLNGFLPDGEYKNWKVTQADGTEVSLNLTEEEKEMFIPGYYQEGYEFGDGTKMYTLPFSKSTEVLYYNKTFFEAHEKDGLKVPTTWDEMEEACRIIKEIDPVSIPLGYDSDANWFITMCEQLGTPYTSATGEHYLFDTPENRAFVERFKTWFTNKWLTTQGITGSYTSSLFIEETPGQRSYMCIGSSAGAKNQVPTPTDDGYPFEVGIVPIPQAYSTDPENENYKEGYQPKVISQGPSVCIFKDEDPQKVLASWLFVKYLTTSIDFQAEFSTTNGYVPVLQLEYMRQNATYANHLDRANGTTRLTALAALVCMEQAEYYYTSPAFNGSSVARDEVGLLMTAALSGSKSIDQAFREAINECRYG